MSWKENPEYRRLVQKRAEFQPRRKEYLKRDGLRRDQGALFQYGNARIAFLAVLPTGQAHTLLPQEFSSTTTGQLNCILRQMEELVFQFSTGGTQIPT